jgi:archaellum component FlaF (FlaF/FlaG flagellin family)
MQLYPSSVLHNHLIKKHKKLSIMNVCSSKKKKGLSSVVSAIILAAAVLVVGGVIWDYANGATSVVATQYYEDSMNLVNELTERYTIEHATNNATHLTVWIYNYGETDIEALVYATKNNNTYSPDTQDPIPISTQSIVNSTITIPLSSGDRVGIKVYTVRQNNVFYSYIAK